MSAARVFLAWVTLAVLFASMGLAKNAEGKNGKESTLGIPCAAFAQDGRWATADFTDSALRVRLGKPSGETRFYDLPVVLKKISPYYFPGCGLFFSPDGHYLAASQSVGDGKQYYRLHIAVLDTDAGKWVSAGGAHIAAVAMCAALRRGP